MIKKNLTAPLKGEATTEQKTAWKAKHKTIFEITVDGSTCYLRKPTRNELSAASMLGKEDPMAFNESIISDCWLGGDEDFKTDDELFLAIGPVLVEVVKQKQADIKKL